MTRVQTIAAVTQDMLSAPRLTSALATSSIAIAILAWTIHNLMGWAGLVAVLSLQVLLSVASAWARRESLDRTGLLPISLVVFVGFSALSIVWSQYQWATAGGVAYLIGWTALGVYIALVRDSIQVIRAFGDVLRVVLLASLALEIFSGLLIDEPIRFLGVDAHLADGGPISGLLGNRNDLGLLAIIGGISFIIEWRTRSVVRSLAIGSVIVAAIVLFFTRSPIAWGTAVVAVAVVAVLYGIRRISPERRRFWQFAVLALAILSTVAAWFLRSPIVNALNASGELTYRLRLWQQLWALLQQHFVEGWGWIGQWNTGVFPYNAVDVGSSRPAISAVNAYLDVWFQLGLVGLVAFVGLVGLAFVRSWFLASRKRSVVFTWPAVVLAALMTASLAESGILVEFGWMTFVICCVKASQNLSWRTALRKPLEQESLE